MRNQSRKRPRTKASHRRQTVITSLIPLLLWNATCQAAWAPSDEALSPLQSRVQVEKRPMVSASHFTCNNRNEYTTKRKVSIRSVDWCGSRGMVPLQHYHGASLDGYVPTRPPLEQSSQKLSKSSQFLSNNLDTLSDEERRCLDKKIQAEARASRPLDPDQDLHILYQDSDIAVVHKPSGILCVPGPRRNPSLANLVHKALNVGMDVDKTVVHRLDMDTWGIVVFALTEHALSTLHDDFRQRRVQKTYQALVCGHLPCSELEIDLALERDPYHPPFMRVAGERRALSKNVACAKFINQAPKPSLTHVHVLSWEFLNGLPVTRLELRPHTGRTHQLRVHCAAIGHPIVGDDIYGHFGEGAANGGLTRNGGASKDLQRQIYKLGKPLCLHAQRLCIHHPRTRAPMMFEADASF